MTTTTPPWSSINDGHQSMPTVENPGIFPVQHYSYSTSNGYEEEIKDPNGVDSLKSGKDASREAGAGVKALSLLEDAFGKQAAPNETGYTDADDNAEGTSKEGIQDYKREIDLRRECGANSRALTLLDKAVTGRKPEKPITARKAAIHQYEQAQKSDAATTSDGEARRIQANSVIQPPMELLAVTTRAKKPQTPEDVRDPETVAGMKCKLDWDREKEAQQKALKLLSLLG